jgi:predicted ester cyclase
VSAEENKAFIRRYFEALNRDKSPATLGQWTVDESLKRLITSLEAAFPNYQFAIEDLVAEGDKVAVRVTSELEHRGELMGFPPTGKRATISGIFLYRIADGKIVESWIQSDRLGLLQQLGLVPGPEQQGA